MNKPLLAVALCATATLALLAFEGDGGPPALAGPSTPPQPAPAVPSTAHAATPLRTTVAEPAQPSPEEAIAHAVPTDGREVDPRDYASAEELLASYWKDLWPDVRAELVAAGLDLETYPFEELKTWNEVRLGLADELLRTVSDRRANAAAEKAAWSTPTSAAEVLGREWSEAANLRPLASLEWDEVCGYSHRIEALEENLNAGLDVMLLDAMDDPRLSTVHPIGFPRESLGQGGIRPDQYIVAKAIAIDGWAYELMIRRDQYPELSSWLDELNELRSRRRAALESALEG